MITLGFLLYMTISMHLRLQLFCNCCVFGVKNRERSNSYSIVAIITINLSKVVELNGVLQKRWITLRKMQPSAMI